VPNPLRLGVHRRVAARLLQEHSGLLFASILRIALAGRTSSAASGATLLEQVGALFQFVSIRADEVVCKQGDAADAFFILLRGSARVCARCGHAVAARENARAAPACRSRHSAAPPAPPAQHAARRRSSGCGRRRGA
jgi:hypothetical protein